MTIYFDKGTADAREIEIQSIYINPVLNSLSGTNNIEIRTQEDFPDFTTFIDKPDFNTIEVKDGDLVLPLQGRYNYIREFSINYYPERKIYNVSITVGWEV